MPITSPNNSSSPLPAKQSSYARRNLGWLQLSAIKILLSFWVFWTFISSWLLFYYTPDSEVLTALNFLAYLLCGIIFFSTRQNILSPLGIATIFCWIALIFTTPLFIFFPQKVQLSASMLTNAMLITLTALISFFIGYQIHWRFLTRLIVKITYPRYSFRKLKLFDFLLFFLIVIIGSALRVILASGQVSADRLTLSATYLTGIIYYFLKDGMLFTSSLLLIFSLSFKNRFFLILSLVALFSCGLASVLNGWKGGMVGPLILALIIFWNYAFFSRKKYAPSLFWLVPLLLIIPLMINIGHQQRSILNYGYSTEWADKSESFIVKVLLRFDGTQRLAEVISHETNNGDISLTNDSNFLSLREYGLTSTRYADLYIWGIPYWAQTSKGASGPGGWYIYFGLIGVVLGYSLWGVLYRVFYSSIIKNRHGTELAIALYGYMCLSLVYMWGENSNLTVLLKKFVVVIFLLWIIKQYLLKRIKY